MAEVWEGVIDLVLGDGGRELVVYFWVLSSIEHELVEASDEFIDDGMGRGGRWEGGDWRGGFHGGVELGRGCQGPGGVDLERDLTQVGRRLSRQSLKHYTERHEGDEVAMTPVVTNQRKLRHSKRQGVGGRLVERE